MEASKRSQNHNFCSEFHLLWQGIYNTIMYFRLSNNGLTHSQFDTLITHLADDHCPIANLFLDWNPIYTDDFKAGDSVPFGSNAFYQPPAVAEGETEPLSQFARLISESKKLQVLFLRASGLKDKDLRDICYVLKPDSGHAMNKSLKVLDLSYNDFSGEAV